jgi:serine protease Do
VRRFTIIALLLAASASWPDASSPAWPTTAPAGAAASTPRAPGHGTGAASAAGSLPDFTRIAERTVPAVASISARQIVRRQPSPFDSFFGFDDGDFGGGRVQSSLGSGVVVGADGYILTNNHVVTGEQQRVSLRDLNITVSMGDTAGRAGRRSSAWTRPPTWRC